MTVVFKPPFIPRGFSLLTELTNKRGRVRLNVLAFSVNVRLHSPSSRPPLLGAFLCCQNGRKERVFVIVGVTF